MAISITKYVDITSGVGGNTALPAVELIGRLFTDNQLLPTGAVKEFSSAELVGAYFGTDSDEYLRAAWYFAQVSKNITTPQNISFARWVDEATAPQIYGSKITTLLSTFQGISDGAFSMTLGSVTNVISGLDFTAALSFADVAAVIQEGINDETGLQWTGATVAYDNTSGGFNFVGGDDSVAAIVSVALAGTGTEIMNDIGWGGAAIFSAGAQIETITDVLTNSTDTSNNFGSFIFMPTLNLAQHEEAATWNDGQNNLYQYMVPVSLANYSTWSAGLITYSGTAITLSPISTEYPEMIPMVILAYTNYLAPNAVQNYMFQQFSTITPSVTDSAIAAELDTARVNYYGQTQNAGSNFSFYQNGVLMGGATDATDMNTYANEQWVKTAITAAIMNLLLAVTKVSANPQGISQISSVIQTVVNQALTNGTISVGKTLNNLQILYINEITDNSTAWMQVQISGYWFIVFITTEVVSSVTTYIANYLLVYSKDDVIRKVVGTDVLI